MIKVKHLNKAFGSIPVLRDLNLTVNGPLVLMGPSGCGKTTTLRIIGGFIYPHSGNVYFDGKLINELPPHKREVNTVFQRYALFPHLNVFDNVAFGLKLKKLDKREINKRVKEMLEIVNLKGFDKRKVNQLSGGQQQRVAIARTLVTDSPVILADEPTGNLDSDTADEIIEILKTSAHNNKDNSNNIKIKFFLQTIKLFI